MSLTIAAPARPRPPARRLAWPLTLWLILTLLITLLPPATPARAATTGWLQLAALGAARLNHSATLLPDGRLLVAGGSDGAGVIVNTAEIYDPGSGAWSPAAALGAARWYHTATLLPAGRVLVTGGLGPSGSLASAEIYDPVANAWSPAAPMAAARHFHTATRLSDGQVLVVGSDGAAERYDPAADSWQPAAALSRGRTFHTATRLPDGRVLVTGAGSAEIYDPAADAWSSAGTMRAVRDRHTATALSDGRVLVAGGFNGAAQLSSAEIYDPATGSWAEVAPMPRPVREHSATLLTNGQVLVAGGFSGPAGVYPRETVRYDSGSDTWIASGTLPGVGRDRLSATLLPDGQVLVAGGGDGTRATTAVDRFVLDGGGWSSAAGLADGRRKHTATLLPDGRLLVAGGYNDTDPAGDAGGNFPGYADAAIYDPAADGWSAAAPLSVPRYDHTATLLPSGRVLVIGGNLSTRTLTTTLVLTTTELYDPATASWSPAAPMGTARSLHTATLLADGRVLVVGGTDAYPTINPLASAAIYDPQTNSWSPAAGLTVARARHTATLLRDGRVLVAGGVLAGGVTASTAIYNPGTDSWSNAGNLTIGRGNHTATLLRDGDVLAVGGSDGSARRDSGVGLAERYDVSAGAWRTAGSLSSARLWHDAVLLPDGDVLVAGGENDTYPTAVERYDPVAESWRGAGALTTPRSDYTLSLLPSGEALAVGGFRLPGRETAGVERYDPGPPVEDARRPLISAIDPVTAPGDALVVSGSSFPAWNEASSGSNQSSPANSPLLRLQSLSNGLISYLPAQPATDGAPGVRRYTVPADFPAGYAMASLVVAGIAGEARLTRVERDKRWYVAPDGSDSNACRSREQPCATIAAALGRAAAGGTVVIAAGTYAENLSISRAVQIVGAGRTATTIDGGGLDRVIAVGAAATVAIADLTIRGGSVSGVNSGGGIFNQGDLRLRRVTLSDNQAGWSGGAISSIGPLTIADSTLSGNRANYGGAIEHSGTLTITASLLANNQTTVDGGALFSAGPALVQSSVLSDNSANLGGAIFTRFDLTLANSDLVGNQANNGGAIFNSRLVTETSALTISGGALRDNRALNGTGGAIFSDGEATVTDAQLTGNQATGAGGAIWNGGTLTIVASTASGNQAGAGGGGLSSSGALTIIGATLRGNRAPQGGGIAASGALTITDSLIAENQAVDGQPGSTLGGGLWVDGSASLSGVTIRDNSSTGAGGGIYNLGILTLRDSTISANQASVGGGLSNAGPSGTAILRSATLAANVATGEGGGAFNSGALRVEESRIEGNRAFGGGGIANRGALIMATSSVSDNTSDGSGGGLYNVMGELTVQRSTVSGNRSIGPGGGIGSLNIGATLVISDSTISGNVAVDNGDGTIPGKGGGVSTTSDATVVNSTISGNTATGGGGVWLGRAALTISNSTIVRNVATSQVGGIYGGDAGEVRLAGSIVAENQGGSYPDCIGPIDSQGYNLIGSAQGCTLSPADGDQVGTVDTPIDPLLGPLADNGGPTWTHRPRVGSPAIDAGGDDCPATDQNGIARPAGLACDSGAVEWQLAVGTGFNPARETFGFPNSQGTPDPIAFFKDAGVAATTHMITRTEVIDTITGESLGLPISFTDTEMAAELPMTPTDTLETGDEEIIPRPVAWLFEEVVVSQLFSDPTEGGYTGAVLGGRCVGMSAGVAQFRWSGGPSPADFLPGATIVRELPENEELLKLIDTFQARQVGLDVLAYQLGPGYFDARSLYRHLYQRMGSPDWWENPEVIGIFNTDGCAEFEVGHALLPYKLELVDGRKARIYVYDSNYPPQANSAELFITIDFAANTWSYPIAPVDGEIWDGTTIYSIPMEVFRQDLRLPYLRQADGDPADDLLIAVGGGVQQAWGGRGKGAWGGRGKGAWGDDTFVGCIILPDGTVIYREELGRSMRLRPIGGATPPALVVRPPAGGADVTFSGVGVPNDPSGDLLIFGPGGVMGFRTDTVPGRTYSATVGLDFRELTLRTDDRARPMSAFQMHETADGAATRIFAVSNVLVGADDGITVAVDRDLNHVAVRNLGDAPVTITLGLGAIGSAAVTTVQQTYTILPGATHTFTPTNWDDLNDEMIEEIRLPNLDRVADGLVALYDFTAGAGGRVVNRATPDLVPDLTLADPAAARWRREGLALTAPTLLRAAGPAAALTQQLVANQGFSVEVWATPATAPGTLSALLSLGGAGYETNLVLFQKRNRATLRFTGRVRLGADPAGVRLTDTPRRPITDRPIHVLLTRSPQGLTQIYVDGQLAATSRHRDRMTAWDAAATLTLGNTLKGDRAWLGTYHLVAIYDRPLSPSEIQHNFAAGFGR